MNCKVQGVGRLCCFGIMQIELAHSTENVFFSPLTSHL